MAPEASRNAAKPHTNRKIPSEAYISKLARLAEAYAEINPKTGVYLFEALIEAIKASRDSPEVCRSQEEAEDILLIRRRIYILEHQTGAGQAQQISKQTCKADILQEFLNVFRSSN